MNTYINRFSFSVNNFKDEIAIVFAQDSPKFTVEGNIEDVNYEPVANLVMSRRVATDLATKLLEVLNMSDDAPVESPQQ